MSETGVRGIDLFKIAGKSISGWIPRWKIARATSELSAHPFWTEGSDKRPSAQYLRPNLQPIYQIQSRKSAEGR